MPAPNQAQLPQAEAQQPINMQTMEQPLNRSQTEKQLNHRVSITQSTKKKMVMKQRNRKRVKIQLEIKIAKSKNNKTLKNSSLTFISLVMEAPRICKVKAQKMIRSMIQERSFTSKIKRKRAKKKRGIHLILMTCQIILRNSNHNNK